MKKARRAGDFFVFSFLPPPLRGVCIHICVDMADADADADAEANADADAKLMLMTRRFRSELLA